MWTLVKLWLGDLYVFLKPTIKLFLNEAGKALAVAATRAVQAVAEGALTGDDERRKTAIRMIKEDLREQGYTIGVDIATHAINLAIETAVSSLKEKSS